MCVCVCVCVVVLSECVCVCVCVCVTVSVCVCVSSVHDNLHFVVPRAAVAGSFTIFQSHLLPTDSVEAEQHSMSRQSVTATLST